MIRRFALNWSISALGNCGMTDRETSDLSRRVQIELPHQIVLVNFDCLDCDIQLDGDVFDLLRFSHQVKNFSFPCGEDGQIGHQFSTSAKTGSGTIRPSTFKVQARSSCFSTIRIK